MGLEKYSPKKIESEKTIANKLITDLKAKHDMTSTELEHESKNTKNLQIDLASAQAKLNEYLADYKSSIEKLKQASNVRYSKLKKKLMHFCHRAETFCVFDEF